MDTLGDFACDRDTRGDFASDTLGDFGKFCTSCAIDQFWLTLGDFDCDKRLEVTFICAICANGFEFETLGLLTFSILSLLLFDTKFAMSFSLLCLLAFS